MSSPNDQPIKTVFEIKSKNSYVPISTGPPFYVYATQIQVAYNRLIPPGPKQKSLGGTQQLLESLEKIKFYEADLTQLSLL